MNNPQNPKSSLKVVVMAAELFNKINERLTPEELEKLIDEYVKLDNPNGLGSPFRAPNKIQTTDVYKGDIMEWSISTLYNEGGLDQDYKVVLDLVNQDVKKGSTGFFTENPLKPNANGNIVGEVLNSHIPNDSEENYTIFFHITKGAESTKLLPIDPRIRIKQ
jgi:hypothetical protein